MRLPVTSATLAAAIGLTPVAVGCAPALAQDFSITNQVEPANLGRRDIVRQLQAWWDVHAYYPRRALEKEEDGTVKIRLLIHPDGNIETAAVAESSGSRSLDAAGIATFRGGFVRAFPAGSPDAIIVLSLHYVLGPRNQQPVAASTKPAAFKGPFTITNEPAGSPILDTMLQRTCTGTVVKEGIRNHPGYGTQAAAQAIFFRRSDNTPWVKFYEGGFPIISPVTQVGKLVQWTGREEHVNRGISQYTQYTVWPDGEGTLGGYLEIQYPAHDPDAYEALNHGGTVNLTCATETVPAIAWSAWSVTPGRSPIGDPP